MHLEDYRMTGKEFEELYKRMKRTFKSVQKFADHIKIGRTAVYEAWDMEQIPHDIDEAIDRDPELSRVKNKIMRGDETDEPEEESTEMYVGPNAALQNEMINSILKINNELVESHKTYREMVQQAFKAGAMYFDKAKAVPIAIKI